MNNSYTKIETLGLEKVYKHTRSDIESKKKLFLSNPNPELKKQISDLQRLEQEIYLELQFRKAQG